MKARKPTSSEPPKEKRTIVHFIVYLAGLVGIITVLLLAIIGYIIAQPLPDISIDAIQRQSSRPSTIFAADGSVLAKWHGDLERQPMETHEFPQLIFNATVAVEDQRFFDHSGLDARGIIRAIQRNYQAGEITEGGSTITQQLMKMMYVGQDQTMIRKINEAILASRVELERDKRDILAAYLNMAFFGQGAYGLSAASEAFFDVEPHELTVGQAATLAGVLHMPSAYRPHEDIEPLQNRRDTVLDMMYEQNLVSRAEYLDAREAPLELAPRRSKTADAKSPFFVDYVARELHNYLDDERIAQGGLNIYTTLDPEVQAAAEAAADLFNKKEEGPTISMVTMRHSDGAILALVGGKDWDTKQFNIAVQARRQPGSAFKPLTLIAAMEAGISPDRSFAATPYEIMVKDELWRVENYGGAVPAANMTVRAATIHSVNTVYARLIIELGPQQVVELAKDLGFAAPMEPDPALSLGGLRYGVSPLEMARAYTTIARAGIDIEPRAINFITDALDEDEILYQLPQELPTQRIYSQETGTVVRDILREVVTQGTGRRADIPDVAVSGKTGTTQNYYDAWFVGWAQGVTTAVWMGYPEAQISLHNVGERSVVVGGSFPAEIWRSFMERALQLRPETGLKGRGSSSAPNPDGSETGEVETRPIPTLEEIGRAP